MEQEISIYFRGTREQRPKFEGNRRPKTIFGNMEQKERVLFILEEQETRGTAEQDDLFLGNKGTGTPLGKASSLDKQASLSIN